VQAQQLRATFNICAGQGTRSAVSYQQESTSTRDRQAPGKDCLAGCRTGDRQAIKRLFEDNCSLVERVIGRLVGPTPDLEDLVQETFAKALHALPAYRGEASLRTWLTSIAVHVAQHHLRAGRLRRHAPLELVDERHLPACAPEAEAHVDERRFSSRIHGLLDQIPPKHRIALLLFTVEGKSVAEVAALMGASQTATRSRVFFARRALRSLICEDAGLSELAASLLGPRREGTT
jgi:RNA polymerase sigma-70 factor (ECF subfamily)